MIRLIRELRQRRVFRGAGYYLLAAWGVLQVGDVIVEPAGLPGWSMTALLYLLVLGFPVAMVLSWRYDLGEHGIVRTRNIGDDTEPEGLRAVDYLLLAGLLTISGAALYQLLPIARKAEESVATAPAGSPALKELRPNSIAVLPFSDISQNRDQEFLGDGISDTVMHVLSQIGQLSVTARTSSFAFKGKDLSIPEIAAILSVAHVLEGSVQRAGDKVRIIARLIDARVGSEVWSGYYDRTLDSIFAIQDEIAREVAAALTTEVLKTGESAEVDTGYRPNLAAYEKFILGKQKLSDQANMDPAAARELFEQAVALDPDYALAHTFLAQAIFVAASPNERATALAEASEVVAVALDLDPQLSEAHSTSALLLQFQKRFDEADSAIARALELQPSNANAHATLALMRYSQGRFDESLESIREAIELDPQENRYRTQLAQALWSVSRAEEAVAMVKEAIRRNPDIPGNYGMLARWSQQLGDVGRGAYWSYRAGLMAPESRFTYWAECQHLVQFWAVERAIACVERFLERFPGDTEGNHYLALLTDDLELGLATMREAVAKNPKFAYRRYQLSDWLIEAGEWEELVEVLSPLSPGLLQEQPQINDFNIWAARNLAKAYRELGEEARAKAIAEAGLAHIERRRKLQAAGYVAGVEDVQFLLVLGREDEALKRLQRTVNSGWRFYSFILTHAFFDPVRDDPRFQEAVQTIKEDVAEQLAWFDEHRDDPIASVGI